MSVQDKIEKAKEVAFQYAQIAKAIDAEAKI